MPRRTLQAAIVAAVITIATSAGATAPRPSARGIDTMAAANASIGANRWIAGLIRNKQRADRAAVAEYVQAQQPEPSPAPPPVAQKPVAAPVPTPPAGNGRPRYETPISNWTCANPNGHVPRPDIGALIQQIFGPAAPWAESVAVRESGCQPGVMNSGGCQGLFQFCGHDDIFAAICGSVSRWPEPSCAVRAAYSLYIGSGIGPWAL